jgi:hypothetical protein
VASSIIEQHQKLVYMRNCSGAYELALLPETVVNVVEAAPLRRASHEAASGSK